jgi:Tol biopolymer transport system component
MGLVTTLALIAAGVAYTRLGAGRTSTIAFIIPAPAQASPRMQLDPFTTISPDGRHVAFTLRNPAGGGDLWLRSLDSFEARVLPGTEGAFIPFWSADSTEIAFFTDHDQQLKAVAHTGGTVRVLCAAVDPLGGTWNRDGTILFSGVTTGADRSGTATSGVHRVSQAGGAAAAVVVSGGNVPKRGRLRRYGANESWPQFLPDGRHFIYLDRDTNTIRVRTLDSDQSAALLTADSQAVYAGPGHLLFVRQGSLMAQPFDASGLTLSGEPFRVLENVRFDTSLGGAVFSASANGTLAYSAGLIQGPSRAAWVNHAGQPGERMELATISLSNRLSPDGRQLVQDRVTPGELGDLWVFDLMRRQSVRRLTSSVADEEAPIWSPDGAQVAYASNPHGVYDIYRIATSGSGREEILFTSRQDKSPSDWSHDGRLIAFSAFAPETKEDIWLLDLQAGRKAVPVAITTAAESNARCSPSGHLIAYQSDQTGRAEIYIQKIPTGTAVPASIEGGFEPFWRQDGKELYFRSPDNRLMSVTVEMDARSAAGLRVNGPRRLFELPHHCGLDRCVDVEATADGRLLVVTADAAAQAPMHVIVNWASVTNRGRTTP